MTPQVQGRAAYAYTGGKPLDPALPCVVLLHGALNDHSVWTLLARWLAHHGHGVLAPDLPGHGRSAGPVLPDIEALADWTLALLDACGVGGGSALVGHSMGSLVALQAAAQASDRVSRLVMVATACPMKVAPALLDAAAADPLLAIDRVNALSIGSLASKPSFPGPGMWLHGSGRALMRRMLGGPNAAGCAVNLFHHDFGVCDRYQAGMQAAERVRCPATLVLGAQDRMTPPRAAGAIAAALQARIVELPCGHSVPAETPAGLLAAVREALV